MAKKFWTINNLRKILKPIGYATIGGLGVFFFTLRLDAKEEVIKEKEAQIEQMKVFQYSNVSAEFEGLKNLYKNQKEMYEMKIQALISANGDTKQIDIYRKKILELETKLNLLTQVADDYTKRILPVRL